MKIPQIITNALEISTPNSSKPVVSFYYGIEGIKQVYLDTLNLPKKEAIYAFLNPEKVHPEIYQWLTKEYVKKRTKKGIFAHVFVTEDKDSSKAKKYKERDKKENRTTYFVEAFDYHFECEVDIYGDKVAFINHSPKGLLIGIVINDPIITKTLKAFYLHYLWKS